MYIIMNAVQFSVHLHFERPGYEVQAHTNCHKVYVIFLNFNTYIIAYFLIAINTVYTHHICFIFKFMSEVDVSDETTTLLLRVSPRHGRTYRTHLQRQSKLC